MKETIKTEARTEQTFLSHVKELLIIILIPSMYLIPVAVAFFSPKNFGFGHRWIVPVALGVGLVGLALVILSIIHLGKSLAVLPGSNRLVTRGVYRYLRHPIYIGLTMTIFGLVVASGSVFGLGFLFVVVIPLNIVRACLEEKALRKKFGKEYEAYRAGTWL